MMKITVMHFDRAGGKLDSAIHELFQKHSGHCLGAGTFLPTGERDMEYEVPNDQAESCRAALKDLLRSHGDSWRIRTRPDDACPECGVVGGKHKLDCSFGRETNRFTADEN